jgi:hypothetical protein
MLDVVVVVVVFRSQVKLSWSSDDFPRGAQLLNHVSVEGKKDIVRIGRSSDFIGTGLK